jgi:hypothetical protein
MPGFEPATYRLQGGCSTTELKGRILFGAPEGIRTPNTEILSLLPLPVGLQGRLYAVQRATIFSAFSHLRLSVALNLGIAYRRAMQVFGLDYLVRPILAAKQLALSLCMPTDSIPVATLTKCVSSHSNIAIVLQKLHSIYRYAHGKIPRLENTSYYPQAVYIGQGERT